MGLLWGQREMGALHLRFWPFAALTLLFVGATLAALVLGLWRVARGPHRGKAFGRMVCALVPMGLTGGSFGYAAWSWQSRQGPRNIAMGTAELVGATLMEGQAAFTYPHRIETPHLVMFYRTLATPRQDAEEMERHVVQMAAYLKRPPRERIHWIRGELLGRSGLSFYGLSLGSAESPQRWQTAHLDRHELAHSVIWQQLPLSADPPAFLVEGWAESQSGQSSRMLACSALRSRANGQPFHIREWLRPEWYHRHDGLVYSQGGAFVDFLLRRFGPARFLEFYDTADAHNFDAVCRRVFQTDIMTLETQFWEVARNGWHDAAPITEIHLPKFVLPVPNAFDSYQQAVKALVGTDKIDTAFKDGNAEVVGLAQQNTTALRLIRQGLKQSYRQPPIGFREDAFSLRRFRTLGRLLLLEGRAKARQGDWAGALASQLDALHLGFALLRNGSLLSVAFGVAIQEEAAPEASAAVSHLTTSQARTAARCLKTLCAQRPPFADGVREEKWAMLAILQSLFRRPDWHSRLKELIGDETEGRRQWLAQLENSVTVFGLTPELVLDGYRRYMEAWEAITRRPYTAATAEPEEPGDPINAYLFPQVGAAWERYRQTETQTNALLEALRQKSH